MELQAETNREGEPQGGSTFFFPGLKMGKKCLVRIPVWEVLLQQVTRLSTVHWWIIGFTANFLPDISNTYKAVIRYMSHSYDGSGKQHTDHVFIPVGLICIPPQRSTTAASLICQITCGSQGKNL